MILYRRNKCLYTRRGEVVSREVDLGSDRLHRLHLQYTYRERNSSVFPRTSSANLLRFRPYLASGIVARAGWQRRRTTGEGTKKVYKKQERKADCMYICGREDPPGDREIRSRKRRRRRWRWEYIVDRRTRSDVSRARTGHVCSRLVLDREGDRGPRPASVTCPLMDKLRPADSTITRAPFANLLRVLLVSRMDDFVFLSMS